jgi:hypothetical protein
VGYRLVVVVPVQGVSGRWLVLTAGMGAGHDQVAGEVAGRIRARGGRVLVDLPVAYSNPCDLREQLQRAVILSEEARQDDGPDSSTEGEVRSATRWWNLRDRFSANDLHTMIDLYKSGTTAKQVTEKYKYDSHGLTRHKNKPSPHSKHVESHAVVVAKAATISLTRKGAPDFYAR